MTRRSAAACGVVAAVSLLTSSGCCFCRPLFCWRGSCSPPLYNPAPAPVFPRLNAAFTGGVPVPGGPVADGPAMSGGPDCVGCGAAPAVGGPILAGPPAVAGYPSGLIPQGYALPPQPGIVGPPSMPLGQPRVQPDVPPTQMPGGGGSTPMNTPKN